MILKRKLKKFNHNQRKLEKINLKNFILLYISNSIKDFDIIDGETKWSIYHNFGIEVRPKSLECFTFYSAIDYQTDIELECATTNYFTGFIRDYKAEFLK